MKRQTLIIAFMTSLLFGLTACGPKAGEAEVPVAATEAKPLINDLLLEEVPETVPGLLEAMEASDPGEEFVFTARVGGMKTPISDGYAGFVVADEILVFCDEMGDNGHCPTPWDACCEDSDKLIESRAFVQFVDDSGNLLEMDLKATAGIKENDTVVVKGRLSPDSAPRSTIIIASGLAVVD